VQTKDRRQAENALRSAAIRASATRKHSKHSPYGLKQWLAPHRILSPSPQKIDRLHSAKKISAYDMALFAGI